jgi:hypothetical protein
MGDRHPPTFFSRILPVRRGVRDESWGFSANTSVERKLGRLLIDRGWLVGSPAMTGASCFAVHMPRRERTRFASFGCGNISAPHSETGASLLTDIAPKLRGLSEYALI